MTLPLLLMWGYLSYSRRHVPNSVNFDSVALIISLASGSALLFCIPMKLPVRLATFILHALADGCALFVFTVYYVCYNFNACF